MEYFIIIFFSYLSGSIPFGLILTKFFIKKDIRKIGSGNIGATNVLRTGNKSLAIITLFFDVIKGFIPIIIFKEYYPNSIELACIFAFLGHLFPVWLKFNGGKGVATYLGILGALTIQLFLLFIFTWLVVFLIFRYSSVSSMFAALTVLVVNILRNTAIYSNELILSDFYNIDSKMLFTFFILLVFTHRKNISNLKSKKEKKIKI